MIDAVLAAAKGMSDDMFRLSIISQNLANSTTPAFKKQLIVNRPFVDYLLATQGNRLERGAIAVPLPQALTIVDHKTGPLTYTGNPLDIALESDGFFELDTENGPVYTRQGNFQLDERGRLISATGLPVMGASGEILLTTTQPRIEQNGNIFEGDKLVAQLRVTKFADVNSLSSIGAGVYVANDAATATQINGRLRQGYIEASNVSSMTEMVRMIETMRHFESSQKVIQSYDQMMDKVMRTLGEF